MPILREQDFDKIATRVVDKFLAGTAKLAEAAAEEAADAGMNPDQIERLSQSANTMAFLRMMEDRKAQGAGDLMHEFDPIDARQVIKIVIDNTGVTVNGKPVDTQAPEGSGESEHELPNELAALHGKPEAPAPPPAPPKKVDEADGGDEDDGKPESPKEASHRIMRMRKLAGILEDQYLQAELSFEDTYEKLAGRFKRVYNKVSYEAFEKDALAEHGDDVGIQVLNSVRTARGLPAFEAKVAMEKTAALADRHVSDETPELYLFESMVKLAREASRLRQGLSYVRTKCV